MKLSSILLIILVLMIQGCSSVKNRISRANELFALKKYHTQKHIPACSKQGFNYYPVQNVVSDSPSPSIPQEVTCTKMGVITKCQDTSAGWNRMLKQSQKLVDSVNPNSANSTDINSKARGSYIRSCIDTKLTTDKEYQQARRNVFTKYN